MNDVLLALYALPLALVLWLYIRIRCHREGVDATVWRQNLEAGLVEPPSLHPVFDPTLCMGSGACTKACPEKALGFVNGKAQLVNPTACIGHGACAATCPVEAIKLVFGTERRGIDIPHVKPTFETNVPGVYIAGELGGMGLIRKAAQQGRQAIESLRKRRAKGDELDVVIVGAGPAGLSATLAAMQHKLKFVTLEQEGSLGGTVFHYPRNKIVMTQPVTLPIVGKMKFGEVSKEGLLAFWQDIVERVSLPVQYGQRVEKVVPLNDSFEVVTSLTRYRTKSVLLALGRRGTPRKLGVPGEQLPKVVYRLLDAEQYSGKHVLVVGGGDAAIEAALSVAEQPGSHVTLSYRGEVFGRLKL
ncbi:MAG TPA: NAD(P)-binding domain-containing protein, partial [Burkholderiales bacterium]|nr:NAD(P)-binding domain-containing protein [Burkholderiales bacterium]